MKIKLNHRGEELWLESDEHNFIVHRGFKEQVDKNGKITQTRIDPSYFSKL